MFKRIENLGSYGKPKEINIPKINKDFAWLIGVYLGDGNIDKGNLTLRVCDKDFALEFVRCIEQLFQVKIRVIGYPSQIVNQRKQYKCVLCRKILADYLIKITNNKHNIPKIIFNSNKEIKEGMIQGLYDSEGCVKKSRSSREIDFCNADKSLVNDLMKLLTLLNIKHSIYKDRSYLRVKVFAKQEVMKINWFRISRKKQKLKEIYADNVLKAHKVYSSRKTLNKYQREYRRINKDELNEKRRELRRLKKQ